MKDSSTFSTGIAPSGSQSQALPFTAADELAHSLGLTPEIIRERLELMGLTAEARLDLGAVAGAVEEGADVFVTRLYGHLLLSPSTSKWFQRPGTVERLKEQQRRYLLEIFSSPIQWEYVLRRLQIGVVHHRVRLTPRWYLATCAHFVCAHVPLLMGSSADYGVGVKRIVTLLKTILFDASLVLEAYGMSLEHSLRTGRQGSGDAPVVEPQGATPSSDEGSAESGPPQLLSRLHLTDDDCGERQSFLEIDEGTLLILRELTPMIQEALPGMLEGFYGTFRRWSATSSMLPDSVVERLVKQVSSYWLELSQAKFDRPYAASRTRVGIVHERIGVTAPIYLTGLACQVGSLLHAIGQQPDTAIARITSVVKAVFYDASFVLDAYMDTRATNVLRHEGYANQLLANLTLGVAVLDGQYRVSYANTSLLQLLGVEAGIVRHMQARDLLADHRLDSILSDVVNNRGARRHLRTQFGGRQLRITVFQMALGAENPAAAPLALLVEDLTQADSATPEFRQLESGLEAVVSAVDAVLWEADLRDWIFTMVSFPILTLSGYRDTHFLGCPGAWPALIPEPDRARFLMECGQLRPGQKHIITHRLITASGPTRWVRTHVARSGNESGVPLIRGVTLDVSTSFHEEQRRLEAVGRLAGSMAHEMNGVLAIVSGSLGLIAGAQVAAQAEDIRTASEAVRRGAALTRRLQVFAQGAPLRPVPGNLNDLIQSKMQDLRLAVGPSTEVRFEPSPALWSCLIDQSLFGGALANLVANARESMIAGGFIHLSTKNVKADDIDLAADVASFADHVEVAVTDGGAGMDDDVRRRATKPCFTTKSGAAGLGLSMVYGFVHQSRGHMVIESREGVGSTVRLRFPRAAIAGASTGSSPGGGAPRKRVLVVDDEVALGSLLQRLLTHQGFDAQVAHSAEEARQAVQARPPDVLLCDVLFHGEPIGIELGREFRSRYPHLPVIYMSGFAKLVPDLKPDELFISKPFPATELRELILKALGHSGDHSTTN